MPSSRKFKIGTLILIVVLIASFHYFTRPSSEYQHAALRTLFYLPLILSAFWFGLRGVIAVILLVAFFYLPYVFNVWQGFTIQDFTRILEGTVFNTLGIVLGFLVEKEHERSRELIRIERLASIGKAVAEVAHDLKAPLMAIGGFTNQVIRKLDPDDVNRAKLEIVIKETARMERMVKEMLDFGRPLELDLKDTHIHQLAEEAIGIVSPEAEARRVQIQTSFDPALPVLRVDEVKINQVMINLIMNAVQASPENSVVKVQVKKNDGKLIIEVEDSGVGIQAENRDAVFQPFFTTKKEGTGLGLPIVRRIVEAHGGDVHWRPNPDGGVTFYVTLPI